MKKFEHGRLSGRGGYAPARRDRAPFPSQRLNVDVFSPPLFLFLSFLFFPLPHPSPIPRFSLPFLVEIPRGAHSIIRYLCRTRHKSNPWQEKRPSLVHDGPRNAHPFLLLLSCHSSSPLPHSLIAVLPRLASANLATIPRFFPRVTRFRSQPDSRLNIYCPLGLINDTFLASCWS